MMWIRHLVIIVTGLSAGLMVAGGMFTALFTVGLLPRFAGKTRTGTQVKTYENAVILGSIFWNEVSLYHIPLPFGIVVTSLFGFFAGIFVGYDKELFEITKNGFAIYSMSFLMMGLNIYGSSFFTALGNGIVSAVISFLRTLLFQVAAVLILPIYFGLNGVWFAIVAAEGMALIVSVAFLIFYRKKYGY